MNFLLYLFSPSVDVQDVLPEYKNEYIDFIYSMRKANISIPVQKRILKPLQEQSADPDAPFFESLKEAGKIVQSQKKNRAEWMDFFLFAFLYLGLYQGAAQHYVLPFLENGSFEANMNLSLGLLMDTILVYFVMKGMIAILASRVQSWKRWGCFLLLVMAYFGGLYAFDKLSMGISVPVWIVLLVSGILAVYSWNWNQKYFLFGRHEKRVE